MSMPDIARAISDGVRFHASVHPKMESRRRRGRRKSMPDGHDGSPRDTTEGPSNVRSALGSAKLQPNLKKIPEIFGVYGELKALRERIETSSLYARHLNTMTSEALAVEPDPVLIAFGDLTPYNSSLTADHIFTCLMSAKIWLVTQSRHCLLPGASVLFYQNRKGFVGKAVIHTLSESSGTDAGACPGLPMRRFPYHLSLKHVHIFKRSVDCRPLIPHLQNIKNKASWGIAFMGTPRAIPLKRILTS